MMMRKNLSPDYLYSLVRKNFDKIEEHRRCLGNIKISLSDALMSGLAIFALKRPSLLSFEQTIRKDTATGRNVRKLFSINTPASDTQMRTILDSLSPKSIRSPFQKIFSALQRSNVLKDFRYLDEGYTIALDGSGHFSSGRIKCDDCLEKISRSKKKTYYHQLLGASIVHPAHKQVIPLCPEAISNRDGDTKQDCELAAGKRWLKKFRSEHSKLEGVIIGDTLYSHAPFINLLSHHGLHYILGVKPKRHKAIFEEFDINKKYRLVQELHTEEIIGVRIKKRVKRTFTFLNGLSLNCSHPDLKVNMLNYVESIEYVNPAEDKKNIGTKVKRFTWITDINLTEDNIFRIMKSARARWKIENETFQTLKKESGYNFDHSYGHGKKNLCTILGMLTMLAFLIDQAQEIACPLFRKALQGRANGTKRTLWELFKSAVEWLILDTWETLLKLAAGLITVRPILKPIPEDTS